MNDYVTTDHCAAQSAAVLEKLESIERRLFVDNGTPSIQMSSKRMFVDSAGKPMRFNPIFVPTASRSCSGRVAMEAGSSSWGQPVNRSDA